MHAHIQVYSLVLKQDTNALALCKHSMRLENLHFWFLSVRKLCCREISAMHDTKFHALNMQALYTCQLRYKSKLFADISITVPMYVASLLPLTAMRG